MGTAGVKFNPDKATIISVLKKHKGVLSKASLDFDVCPHTLRLFINKDEELVQLLKDLRNNFDEELLDGAEATLKYALSLQKEDINSALKSSFFILNNKGRDRGYSLKNYTNNQEVTADDLASFIRKTITVKDTSRTNDASGSEVETEQSL